NVMEADAAGTLTRIVAPEGTTLPIGALLAVVAPPETPDAEIDAFVSQFAVVQPSGDTTVDAAPIAPSELRVLGRTVRCWEMGSGGVPLLFLHGFGADVNSWMFNQPVFCEGRRTLALELPGHGLSSKDVGTGDIGFFTDVIEAAVDAERVHVVGHSMGGALAIAFATRRPERVATVSLLAPAGLGPEINGGFIDAFVRASRRKGAVEALQYLVHDPSVISRAMAEEFLRYKRLDGVVPALEKVAHAWFPQGRQDVNLLAELRALTMPVQVIWGHKDRIIPVRHAEAAAQAHILNDAGHLPHMEKAGEVNRLIRAMIS